MQQAVFSIYWHNYIEAATRIAWNVAWMCVRALESKIDDVLFSDLSHVHADSV